MKAITSLRKASNVFKSASLRRRSSSGAPFLQERRSSSPGSGSDNEKKGKEEKDKEADNTNVAVARVTFVQYLQLCEDRGVIPHCIAPSTLDHIFRWGSVPFLS